MTYKSILISSLVCLICALGLSAAGLAVNLWLGFERNLAGNLGAAIITALLLCHWRGWSLAGNTWLVLYFSILCGIAGVLFLMLLAGLSPFWTYSFDSLSSGEIVLAFMVNAAAFTGTTKLAFRQGSAT
ncbi:hypothetical protein CPA50_13855 [Marinobacter sp. ANT_B65]|nr:hypothetical protein CPA50_13855 [Marinobacter sp. ANT_B65]